MTYTTKSWGNDPPGGTPLNATGLNDWESRIEHGIDGSGVGATGVIYAYDYGVRCDATTPSATFMQNACNAALAIQAGSVILPGTQSPSGPGTGRIKMEGPVFVPNGVRLIGTGNQGTIFDALPAFPTSTPMFYLGNNIPNEIAFGTRLENLSIDMQGVTGGTCVYSSNAQEGSGLLHVGLYGWKAYGAWFDGGGSQNFHLSDITAYGHGSGATGGLAAIYFNNTGPCSVHYATVNPFNTTGMGIRVEGTYACNLTRIHPEQGTNGIYVNNGQACMMGIYGNAATTTLIYLDSSSTQCVLINSNAGGSTNHLHDEVGAFTILGADRGQISLYAQQDALFGIGGGVFPVVREPVVMHNATLKVFRSTTANRQSAASMGAGAQAYDETLHCPIWSDGTNWRNGVGTVV